MTMAHAIGRRAGIALAVLAVLALSAGSTTAGQSAGQAPDVRAGAWDSSVTFEHAGQFRRARQVLLDAYGPRPDSYEVNLRIAWLSLRMGDPDAAIGWYRRAMQMEGAGPEAARGLSSALTLAGYVALGRGDQRSARRRWAEALAIDSGDVDARRGLDIVGPSSSVAFEGWIAAIGASPSSSSAQVVYLLVPVRVSEGLQIRAAYRHIGPGAVAATATPFFLAQDEGYAAIRYEQGVGSVEIIGFGLRRATATVPGGAISVRIGGRLGLTLTGSAMNETSGWNTQAAPEIFGWLGSWGSVSAGIRYTTTSTESMTSALFGASAQFDRVGVDLRTHVGRERSAFTAAGPTILSFAAGTSSGATVTASCRLTRELAIFVQAQVEQLERDTINTSQDRYLGTALGIRWMPNVKTEKKP